MRNRWSILVLAVAGALVAWALWKYGTPQSAVLPDATTAVRVRASCSGLLDEEAFFPDGLFSPHDATIDRQARRDYSGFLKAMQEPGLACGDVPGESYRLLLLERNGSPTAVKVTHRPDGTAMSLVELQAPMWKGPGSITRRVQAPLSDDQWRSLTAAIDQAGFWRLPSFQPWAGDDGSPWILEGRRGTGYHLVERTSPAEGSFKDAGQLLLRLANDAARAR